MRYLFPFWNWRGNNKWLKSALDAGLVIGTPIENIVQVFHRILDLKHGLDFYPGLFYFDNPILISSRCFSNPAFS
jgi:hypothetical protein